MHSYVIFKNVQSCRIKSAVPVLDKGTYERQKYYMKKEVRVSGMLSVGEIFTLSKLC